MSAEKYHYFAYGSNLHPKRLSRRVPSSRLIRLAKLTEHALKIHKRGMDGSAKCNACYTGNPADSVLGVVYEFDADEKAILDQLEDQGQGYEWVEIDVITSQQVNQVHTYLATPDHIDDTLQPFDWYKELVLIGMRYHSYPQEYQTRVEAIRAISDPLDERAAVHARLIHFLTSE